MHFFSGRIKYYERDTSGLRHHVYYLAAIESILAVISLIFNIMNAFLLTSSILFFLVMITFIALLRNPKKKGLIEIILLTKLMLCAAVTFVYYYLNKFSPISDPELFLLVLYFNGFYMTYHIIQNYGEVTEEEINDPEDPPRATPLSTLPTSETDTRDSLPSYEESFNYPNSEFKNNKNVDNIDKTKIDDSNNKNL